MIKKLPKKCSKNKYFLDLILCGFSSSGDGSWGLLGLSKILVGGLWTPNTTKNLWFVKVFGKCPSSVFWWSWWLSEGCLGDTGADLGPKMVPKSCPKLIKKLFRNRSQKSPEKDPDMTQKCAPKYMKPGRDWLGVRVILGVIFGILAKRPQDGAQVAQEGTKITQDRPKTRLRWTKSIKLNDVQCKNN